MTTLPLDQPSPPRPSPIALSALPHTTPLDELIVHFDYSGHLPGGGGTWGAIFSFGAQSCAFGGILAPHQASEEGALEETLYLLNFFNIHAATLFTDDLALFRKRATTLSAGRRLLTCPRHLPEQVRAHHHAQSYRLPYQTLATWQPQLTTRQPLPVMPLPTPPILPTYRRRAGLLFVALHQSGAPHVVHLGPYGKAARTLVPHFTEEVIQARMRKALLRQGGIGIQPVVDRLTQTLWADFLKRLPLLARQSSVHGTPLYPHYAPFVSSLTPAQTAGHALRPGRAQD